MTARDFERTTSHGIGLHCTQMEGLAALALRHEQAGLSTLTIARSRISG
jgi:hypothetical protein